MINRINYSTDKWIVLDLTSKVEFIFLKAGGYLHFKEHPYYVYDTEQEAINKYTELTGYAPVIDIL